MQAESEHTVADPPPGAVGCPAVPSDTFSVVSGAALVLGGVAATAGWLAFAVANPSHDPGHRSWTASNLLIVSGGALLALGLPGAHLHHEARAGALGTVGFVVLFVGIVVPYLAVHSIETAIGAEPVPRVMRILVAVGAPSIAFGTVATGIALLMADVYPAWMGIALLGAAGAGLAGTFTGASPRYRRGVAPALWTTTMALWGASLLASV